MCYYGHMSEARIKLLEALKSQQRILGMTDEAFADYLFISRPLWSQMRSGKTNVHLSLLAGVAYRMPGLQPLTWDYLLSVAQQRGSKAEVTQGR